MGGRNADTPPPPPAISHGNSSSSSVSAGSRRWAPVESPAASSSSRALSGTSNPHGGNRGRNNNNNAKPLKVIVLGDSNVGKTSLVAGLGETAHATSAEESAEVAAMRSAAARVGATRGSTIGVDCQPLWFRLDGTSNNNNNAKVQQQQPSEEGRVKLNVWDTAGQERFRSIVKSYFRNADIALLVCSADDASSVDDLARIWLPAVREVCSPMTACGVLCNKTDLPKRYEEMAASTLTATAPDRAEDEEGGDNDAEESGDADDDDLLEITTAREAAERLARAESLPFAACSMFDDPLPALRVVRSLVREALRRRMATEAAERAAALEAQTFPETAAAAATRQQQNRRDSQLSNRWSPQHQHPSSSSAPRPPPAASAGLDGGFARDDPDIDWMFGPGAQAAARLSSVVSNDARHHRSTYPGTVRLRRPPPATSTMSGRPAPGQPASFWEDDDEDDGLFGFGGGGGGGHHHHRGNGCCRVG